MVRLRVKEALSECVHIKFQFQYGAIESIGQAGGSMICIIFQFQYGAIESQFPL